MYTEKIDEYYHTILTILIYEMALRGNQSKGSARSKASVTLPELPAGKFYAARRKKLGPKRNLLKVSLRATLTAIQNTRKSYMMNYKLQVLS